MIPDGDGTMLARYRTRCSYCGQPIERGDVIEEVAGAWLHAKCPNTDATVGNDPHSAEGEREA